MNREEVIQELSTLVGREVSHRRLAGNTIILYFNGQPGEDRTSSLRLDPSWRYSKSNQWILGSGDIPWEEDDGESKQDFSVRFNGVCDRCESLVGSVLESIYILKGCSDLDLRFSGEQKLLSFAGYTDDESWVYVGRPKGIKIYGALSHYEVHSI